VSSLANQLVAAEREEVARGVRLLLGNPLITARDMPAGFDLVRRRQDPIARWFDYYCGWSLVVEPRQGYVRLAKIRGDAHARTDASRPARRSRSGRGPFDRRRYTLLCVIAAEVLSTPMTTIGLLAERVVQATRAEPVLGVFDPTRRAERMAYVDVLRLLEGYGAVEVVDGVTEAYLESGEAKVLYRVDATLVMRLLSAPRGPSQLAVPVDEVAGRFDRLLTDLVREPRYGGRAGHPEHGEAIPVSDSQRNLWLRHSVFRLVFDDPVVYRDELTEAQLGYLTSPTGRKLLRDAARHAGFEVEERAEGYLLVDVDGLATDGKFPDDAGTARVAALVLLDVIVAADGGVALEQLGNHASALLDRAPRWAMAYRSEGGADRLVSDALAVLGEFGLVRRAGGLVHALPAAARYAVATLATSGGESE
jgi:uncharacterized protein (TIGR02678 family)